jgi:tetratricopeptide (TPR) repeat protein
LRLALDAAGVEVVCPLPDWGWAQEEAERFRELLGELPSGRERLGKIVAVERQLRSRLERPLDLQQIYSDSWLSALEAEQRSLLELLGDGPGSAYQAAWRAQVRAGLEQASGGVFLVGLSELPVLLGEPPDLSGFHPGEPSRIRALVNRAYALDPRDDQERLFEQLLAEPGDPLTPRSELLYAAGSLLAAQGRWDEAAALLERAAADLPPRPAYLAGFIWTRLGQILDLAGRRGAALPCYQRALELCWLPEETKRAAQEGLEHGFVLNET